MNDSSIIRHNHGAPALAALVTVSLGASLLASALDRQIGGLRSQPSDLPAQKAGGIAKFVHTRNQPGSGGAPTVVGNPPDASRRPAESAETPR